MEDGGDGDDDWEEGFFEAPAGGEKSFIVAGSGEESKGEVDAELEGPGLERIVPDFEAKLVGEGGKVGECSGVCHSAKCWSVWKMMLCK